MDHIDTEDELLVSSVALYNSRENVVSFNEDMERYRARVLDEGLPFAHIVELVSPGPSTIPDRPHRLWILRGLAKMFRPRWLELHMSFDPTNRHDADLMYHDYGKSKLVVKLSTPIPIRLRDLCRGERLDLDLRTGGLSAGIDVGDLADAVRRCSYVHFIHNFGPGGGGGPGARTLSCPPSETLTALKSLELGIRTGAQRRTAFAFVWLQIRLTQTEVDALHAHWRSHGYTADPALNRVSTAVVRFGRTNFRQDLRRIKITTYVQSVISIEVRAVESDEFTPNESPVVRRHEGGG